MHLNLYFQRGFLENLAMAVQRAMTYWWENKVS